MVLWLWTFEEFWYRESESPPLVLGNLCVKTSASQSMYDVRAVQTTSALADEIVQIQAFKLGLQKIHRMIKEIP